MAAISVSISGPICFLVSVLWEVAGQAPTATDHAAVPCHLSPNELCSTKIKPQTLLPKLLLPRMLSHLHRKEVVQRKQYSIWQYTILPLSLGHFLVPAVWWCWCWPMSWGYWLHRTKSLWVKLGLERVQGSLAYNVETLTLLLRNRRGWRVYTLRVKQESVGFKRER